MRVDGASEMSVLKTGFPRFDREMENGVDRSVVLASTKDFPETRFSPEPRETRFLNAFASSTSSQ